MIRIPDPNDISIEIKKPLCDFKVDIHPAAVASDNLALENFQKVLEQALHATYEQVIDETLLRDAALVADMPEWKDARRAVAANAHSASLRRTQVVRRGRPKKDLWPIAEQAMQGKSRSEAAAELETDEAELRKKLKNIGISYSVLKSQLGGG